MWLLARVWELNNIVQKTQILGKQASFGFLNPVCKTLILTGFDILPLEFAYKFKFWKTRYIISLWWLPNVFQSYLGVAHICAVLIRFSARDVYFTAFTSRECAYSKQGVYVEPGVNFFFRNSRMWNKLLMFIWKDKKDWETDFFSLDTSFLEWLSKRSSQNFKTGSSVWRNCDFTAT